jgi:hypothetical protein
VSSRRERSDEVIEEFIVDALRNSGDMTGDTLAELARKAVRDQDKVRKGVGIGPT